MRPPAPLPSASMAKGENAEIQALRQALARHHTDSKPHYPCNLCGRIDGVPGIDDPHGKSSSS